jgi:hypothetical protein
MGSTVDPAAVREEAVGDHLVDQFRDEEVARRVARYRPQFVHVESHHLLPPAEPPDEVQRLVPSRPPGLRRSGARDDRRVEKIDVDGKVYLVRQPVNQFERGPRIPHEIARWNHHEAPLADKIRLLLRQAPDAHLEGRDAAGKVPHDAGVVVRGSLERLPEVAVGVELDHRQAGVLLLVRPDGADRDAVLAAEDDRHLAQGEVAADGFLDLRGHHLGGIVIPGDRRAGVDADLGRLEAEFLVVDLHVPRGLDDGRGPLCGALLVGGGPVVGDRDHDDPGALEGGPAGIERPEPRRDRLGAAHGMRTAAETTVTHQPRLSPTADWVTLIVR